MRPYKLILILIAVALFGGSFAYVIAPTPQVPEPHSRIVAEEGATLPSEIREELKVQPYVAPSLATTLSPEETEGETTTDAPRATNYTIPILARGTVLNAMYAFAASSNFSFSGREFSGLGLFVEEINGRKNGDGFYWTLFINNELSEKGASQTEVSPADSVEWCYQKGI